MNNLLLKFQLIFWPFVRLTLLVASSYAAFWAVLVWGMGTFCGINVSVDTEFQFVFLWLLGFIAVMLGLRPRIHLFKTGRDDRWRTLYYMVAAAVIGLSAGALASAAQSRLLREVVLPDASELPRYPANTAYVLQHLYLDRNGAAFEEVHGSGKGGRYLHIYAATPIFRDAADTASGHPLAWLGATFRSSSNSNPRVGEDYDGFLNFKKRVAAEVKSLRPTGIAYLIRAGHSDEMLEAIRHSHYASSLNVRPIVLEAEFEPFAERADASLRLFRLTLQWGFAVFAVLLLIPSFKESYVQQYLETGQFPTNNETWKGWLAQARPRPGFYATPVFIAAHAIPLLAMTAAGLGFLNFDQVDLVEWGGLYRPLLWHGERWRLLTGPVLPDGALHFLNAAWALGWLGWHLEKVVGTRWVAGAFSAATLAGSLVSLWWQPGAVVVGAGAGVMGVFALALVAGQRLGTDTPHLDTEKAATLAATFVIIDLIIGVASDHVSWSLLLGGAAGGLLAALAFRAGVLRRG